MSKITREEEMSIQEEYNLLFECLTNVISKSTKEYLTVEGVPYEAKSIITRIKELHQLITQNNKQASEERQC